MIAKTKEQIKVIAWSKKLNPISEKKIDWSIKDQLTHLVYLQKHLQSCFTCGHKWKSDDINNIVCPSCGVKLTIPTFKNYNYEGGKQKEVTIVDKTWSHLQESYTAVMEVHHGYQVFRHLYIHCYMRRYCPRVVSVHEVAQDWISPEGKHTIVAHELNSGMYGSGPTWRFMDHKGIALEMEIKTNKSKYFINSDIVPRGQMTDIFRRTKDLKIDLPWITRSLIYSDYRLEAMLKSGYVRLLKSFIGTYSDIDKKGIAYYWPAIKICQRNKYNMDEMYHMWKEHVIDLVNDKKDIRNAHYVCPPDLRAAHQVYINRREKENKRRSVQALLDRVDELNKEYSKHVERFKDLVIQGDGFTIKPILDVFDMYQEGEKLHHCVFTSHYYYKTDSLILSARTENERLETIQVDIKKMTLVQVHGLMNKNSEKHNDIVVAINNHLPVIRKMVKQRRLSQSA